jgi:competence protein ComEC
MAISAGGTGSGGASAATPPRARGGVLITRPLRLPSAATLLAALLTEAAAQRERILLWTPVAFGLGAAAYLGLKDEPPLQPPLIAAGVMALAAVMAWRRGRSFWLTAVLGLTAVATVGFALAKLHSDAMAAPIAPVRQGMTRIAGWVVDVDTPGQRGERLLIAPVRVAGLAPAATPTRIRIVIGAPGGPESAPAPGTPISLVALLDPPPGPASPGAYDFARDAWFEGIGGVGLSTRQPTLTALPDPPSRLKWEMAVNALRWRVATRLAHDIHAVLGPDDGGAAGLAVAVTTSHQDWLAAEHRDALRGSGLAHMLAIAGLHTAAVSGFAFFAFRLAIAAWPWLAVRVPGKKLAALGALAVVAGYLVLSGAHPPARRAAITASVAFLAILADRRAVSLHSLAIAALAILLIEPDVVLQPGFEMSFCATASLVALAEVWRRGRSATALSWPVRMLQRGRDWLIAMAVVSFVAGAATGPFAIQHFNRVANYGVFANLTADFVASALLMPALALCLAAQAIGLGPDAAAPALAVAGWAARAVIALGKVFAFAPGASVTLSSAPQIALALSYLGVVFACLWRGRLRVVGIPLAFAVALWPRPAPPVAWIAADGDDAAVVIDGAEVPLKPGARAYATQLWAQRRGFALPADPAKAQQAAFDCDRQHCSPLPGVRPAIGAWWTRRPPHADDLADICARAEILILRAPVAPPRDCDHALVLRRGDFEAGGSAEVFADGHGGWRLAWSQPLRGRRPWTFSDTVE